MLSRLLFLLALGLGLSVLPASAADPKIKVLIVDGQNNHKWKETTPLLKAILEKAGIFDVSVATTPEKDTAGFAPKFSDYQVVVSNYNGKAWPKETQAAFLKFVTDGGGFVSYHAADNAFPEWPEYNAMIGVGGWGGRKPDQGAYLRLKDNNFVADTAKGDRAGSHGAQHEFVVDTRVKDHPITKGLPEKWKHGKDELYDRLRGPATGMTVLASAFAEPKQGGSGQHEPMIMVRDYEKGKVVHTTLGHYTDAVKCVGFATTFARAVEWAATGKVTQKVPDNFPTADKVSEWK